MPLLLCPNCNVSMQNVNRAGVELDMCPSCRGIWLDRGEMEKTLGDARQDQAGEQQDRQRFDSEVKDFHRDPDAWRTRHPYDDDQKKHSYDDDYNYRKKKKGLNIFDIFD